MKVEISVLTRTEGNGRRIIEGVYADKKKAEAERQALIKMFGSRPDLLADTEIDTREVDIPLWVVGVMECDARELTVDVASTEAEAQSQLHSQVARVFGDGSKVVDGNIDGLQQSCDDADNEFVKSLSQAKCGVAGELASGEYSEVSIHRF